MISALAAMAFSVAAAAPFRLHLQTEPTQLDPHVQKTAASSYLLQNLHRNLFFERDPEGLQPDLGEKCYRQKKGRVLVCVLKKDLKWSDGKPLTAAQFAAGYRRILDPATRAYRPDLLFTLKNARAIFEGRKTPAELGVAAPDARTLRFEFETVDPEFEHALANFTLAPFRDGDTAAPEARAVTGPYRIAAWKKGSSLRLTANPHYPGGDPARPDVEFRFIEEDGTALRLYRKNELDFLRRLPTAFIPHYRNSPDFHSIPVTRLDYFGFGPRLQKKPRWREALALALDYREMQKLMNSPGRPGCPGVPESWFPDGRIPCIEFDPARAKTLIANDRPAGLTFRFSGQGGEDHRRAAEWLQSQWKKNLGLDVRVEAIENKLFLADLRERPPDVFRKGIAADRATCASVLAPFGPDHPENFMKFDDPEFNALLERTTRDPSGAKRAEACVKAIRLLLSRFIMIPTGRWEFSILARPTFAGWRLNSMNQLDLSELREVATPGAAAAGAPATK